MHVDILKPQSQLEAADVRHASQRQLSPGLISQVGKERLVSPDFAALAVDE